MLFCSTLVSYRVEEQAVPAPLAKFLETSGIYLFEIISNFLNNYSKLLDKKIKNLLIPKLPWIFHWIS